MLFCLVLLHAGFLPALFVFLTWSLPGAIGMYALSLGVQRINTVLPGPAYALLSGLNSSTVGIIALAATQLSEKAIKNRFLRIIIIFGACAGLCYNALWYFPVLMLAGGIVTVVWENGLERWIGKQRAQWKRRRSTPEAVVEENNSTELQKLEEDVSTGTAQQPSETSDQHISRRMTTSGTETNPASESPKESEPSAAPKIIPLPASSRQSTTHHAPADTLHHSIPISIGLAIIVVFFLSFIAILVARGVLHNPPLPLNVFANLYLAGTIIFGGGPVVIPLLREYVVQPGWVSPRDFLIGLAIIQAFPGPNFNFAVFLGALAILYFPPGGDERHWSSILGAFLGYVGIFLPGVALAVGIQAIWRVLRTKPPFVSFLKGVNATAVGLVFTAVYRLWQIGFLSASAAQGESLGVSPWWLVVSGLTYSASRWFGVPAAGSILAGGVLGLVWWGAVGRFEH